MQKPAVQLIFSGTAGPNGCHKIAAELEADGFVSGVITQNVNGLHQAAGSRSIIELHGALERVVCLSCGGVIKPDVVFFGEVYSVLLRKCNCTLGMQLSVIRKIKSGFAAAEQY